MEESPGCFGFSDQRLLFMLAAFPNHFSWQQFSTQVHFFFVWVSSFCFRYDLTILWAPCPVSEVLQRIMCLLEIRHFWLTMLLNIAFFFDIMPHSYHD